MHAPTRVIKLVSEWGITCFIVAPLVTKAKVVRQGYPQGAIAVHAQIGRANVAECLHTPHFLTSLCLVSQSKWLSCGFWTNFLCQWGNQALPARVTQLLSLAIMTQDITSIHILAQGLPWRGKSCVCVRRMRQGVWEVWEDGTACPKNSRDAVLGPESLDSSYSCGSFAAKPAEDPLCRLLEASVPVLAGVDQLCGEGKGKKQQVLQRCSPMRGNSGLLLFLPGLDWTLFFWK